MAAAASFTAVAVAIGHWTAMIDPVPEGYRDFLSEIPIFSALSDNDITHLLPQLVATHYPFGETIVRQGARCDGLYLIFSGSVRLFAHENGKEISMGLRKAGDSFAETNVLRDSPLDYSVRAAARSEVLKIPRVALAELWRQSPNIEEYMIRYAAVKTAGGLVARLFDLKGEIEKKEFESLIETIGIKRVDSGQYVLRQDTLDDRRLYVIRQGRVRVIRCEGDREYQLGVLEKGETFGERAVLFSDNQPASVITESNSTFLIIPDATVKTILAGHPALRSSFEDRITAFEHELERQRKLAAQKAGRWRFSPVVRSGTGEKILNRFPLVEQEEEMDCGAACLAMICRYYGIQTTLEQLRDFADIDRRGATLESLAVVAERLGFIARGVNATFAQLIEFDLPLIVHWQRYHYIVVFGITPHQAYVADPAAGFKNLTLTEFEKGWDGTCLLLERDPRRTGAQNTDATTDRPADFFKPVEPWLTPWLAIALFSGLLAVVPPFLVMYLLDRVILTGDRATVEFLLVGFLGISALTCLANLLRNLLIGYLDHGAVREATSDFIQQVLYQPLDFFEKRKVWDLLDRFQDNDEFWTFFSARAVPLLSAFWAMVSCWVALFYFGPAMAGIYIAIHFPVLILLRSRLRPVPGGTVQSGGKPIVLNDMLEGIETIKAQGAEYWMRRRWETTTAPRHEWLWDQRRGTSFLKFGTQIIQACALTFLVWQAIELHLEHRITAGEFVAAFLLAAGSLRPLADLIEGWMEWLTVRPGLRRIRAINRLPPEQSINQAAENIILPELKGRFSLNNLYFRYQRYSPHVIEGINCEIQAGQWVSFIGPPGSGKTTLAKLLMGFYAIDEGRLDVDGYPVNLLEKGSYRRQIGYLPQHPFLIHGTVLDNIALGIRAPQRKRIVDVCHLVDLNDRINGLASGYDCAVAELNELPWNDLPQRLGVARALYREPSVLIFDQALSALELKAESAILERIRTTYPNITMITFSERINPDLKPDQVFLLYKGRVAESGSCEELKERNRLYGQLLGVTDSRA
jgi:ATP-binding cassette, subfamily B, bacterial HlyB/CyaB